MRFGWVFAVSVVLLGAISAPAKADGRVALVIGNADYRHVARLNNTANDAADIADAFEKLGFSVRRANNLSRSAMVETLAAFSDEASRADIAAIYYAGHGMEVDKQNFLIPVDARLEVDRRVRFETVPLDDVMASLDGARRLKLVLLDACRNNPFAATMKSTGGTRSVGRGLSRVEPTTGTLVGFAAREGTVADDGRDRNSPYAKALLANLSEPSLEINLLFRKVRDEVIAATGGKQEPFTYGSLPGDPIFLAGQPKPEAPAPSPTAPSAEMEIVFWNTVKDSKDRALLESYLERFPEGVFSGLAQVMISRLDKEEAAKAVATPRTQVAAVVPDQAAAPETPETAEEMAALADRYASGEGGTRNLAEAIRLYRLAADRNLARAVYRLGMLHYEGTGADRDPDAAASRLLEAVGMRYQPAVAALTQGESLRDPGFVSAVQRRLKAVGRYDGAIDGLWGSGTRNAILAHAGIAVRPDPSNTGLPPASPPPEKEPKVDAALAAECAEIRLYCRLRPRHSSCEYGENRKKLDSVCKAVPAPSAKADQTSRPDASASRSSSGERSQSAPRSSLPADCGEIRLYCTVYFRNPRCTTGDYRKRLDTVCRGEGRSTDRVARPAASAAESPQAAGPRDRLNTKCTDRRKFHGSC